MQKNLNLHKITFSYRKYTLRVTLPSSVYGCLYLEWKESIIGVLTLGQYLRKH